MKEIRIGVIGGTRGMGKWFADYLAGKGFAVEVLGSKEAHEIPEMAGRSDVVVVAVPIGVTTDTIRKVGPFMAEDSLLMDLTSFKAEPVREMLKWSRSEVIGLHPLFGPGVATLRGENVFICAARGKTWLPWLKHMLLQDGVEPVETTPEKHDEMMGYVQVLTHLGTVVSALVLRECGVDRAELLRFSTPASRMGMDLMDKIFQGNPRLYSELITRNPHARAIAEVFQKNLSRVRSFIEGQDAEALTRLIEGTKNAIAK